MRFGWERLAIAFASAWKELRGEVAAEFKGKDFDRDIPIESGLTCLVDGA